MQAELKTEENTYVALLPDRPKQPVVLRGLHIAVHTPTEERLTVQVEGLTPLQFRDLGFALEDWFEVVDEEFKVKATRGRGWKGRGRRITAQTRVRLLRFSPFPSSFGNILRTLRRDLYFELRRQCLVLEGARRGKYKQNIYILPYANAPAFMAYLQAQDSRIDELNKKTVNFVETSYFGDVQKILKRYGVARILQRRWNVEHVSFDATPLALEPRAIKELVEEEYQRMFRKLEDDEKRGIEALHAELERKRHQLVVKAVDNLRKRLDVIVAKIVAAKKKPEGVKKDLERLRRIAVSVGLEALATTVIDPLAETIDNPEQTEKIFGTKKISSAIEARIQGLIESL